MDKLNFVLPISDPILIFFIVLAIILLTPLLLNRLKIPHIIGLIFAGILVGPTGLGLLARDSSFEIFGKVGMLYIMFLAGVEMDIPDFKKNKNISITYGIYTFVIPMIMGMLVCHLLLKMSFLSSAVMAVMLASQTLVAYPIASRFGVMKNRSVNITIGGTMITDVLALAALAVITGVSNGEMSISFWLILAVSFSLFFSIIFFLYPIIARWFFSRFSDNVSQFIFVLALLFFAAFLSELSGMEDILGAFLAGIVLNKLIPSFSPLMNRLEFVGNAIFIPYFLIGVGMLIDVTVFFQGFTVLFVAIIIVIVALSSKYIAAYFTQKTFGMSKNERLMIFGLSTAHVAATLAIVMVGYNLDLFDDMILNAAVFLILVSCTVSSFAVEKASRKMAEGGVESETVLTKNYQRILVPISNSGSLEDLVGAALLIKYSKPYEPIYGLHVLEDKYQDSEWKIQGRRLLENAVKIASSTDVTMLPIVRYGINIAESINHTIKERNITDVVMGMHHKANIVDGFYGLKIERLIKSANSQILILKCISPINTFKRIIVTVPPKAELESGFTKWVDTVACFSKQLSLTMIMYSHPSTKEALLRYMSEKEYNLLITFEELNDWESDFLITSKDVRRSDLFIVINARYSSVSYSAAMDKLPSLLSKYYSNTNLLLIFPAQFNREHVPSISFVDPLHLDTIKSTDTLSDMQELFQKIGRWFVRHLSSNG